MSGPATSPLVLTVPPELAAADPPGVRARADQHRRDADAAVEQARALRAAVVRLVPAAWLGLGSLGFAGAALLQASSLEAIADTCREVAAALDVLAARLEHARNDALVALRAAQRLDSAAADAARQHVRPEGADPARLSAEQAEVRALENRLVAAASAARSAWAQARAAFDLIAYRMPAMADRMSGAVDDGWRPTASLTAVPAANWRTLVGFPPLCVAGGYAGSGVLVGPDGRRYPVVTPWGETGGQRWTADLVGNTSAKLDGADPGWHQVGVRYGVDVFEPPVSTATKAAVVTAGLAGNAPRIVGRLRPDLLPRLRWTSSGAPSLEPAPTHGAGRTTGTGSVPRSRLVRRESGLSWTTDTSTAPADRGATRRNPDLGSTNVTPVGPNAIGLVDSGLAAAGTARRLDDSRTAAYRATFEENDDGRLRARLTTYRVQEGTAGLTVLAEDVSPLPDGQLRRDPVRYRAPAQPVMQAAPEAPGN